MIGDMTLNVKGQSWAVLAILAEAEPDFAPINGIEIQTWAWYNGRERAFALTCSAPKGRKRLVIVCGEHRSSDSIFIDHWVDNRSAFDPPTLAEMPESAWKERKSVGAYNVGAAVACIYDLMQAFYLAETKTKKARKAS